MNAGEDFKLMTKKEFEKANLATNKASKSLHKLNQEFMNHKNYVNVENLMPNTTTNNLRPTSSTLVMNSAMYSKTKYADRIANHCGMNFNNRDKIYVDFNSVSTRPVTSSVRPGTGTRPVTGNNYLKSFTRIGTATTNNNMSPRAGSPIPSAKAIYDNFNRAQNPIPNSPTPSSPKVRGVQSPLNNKQNIPKSKTNNNTENFFGEGGNLFYNGELKSLRLIGPPSNTNRIAKIVNEVEENNKKQSPKKKVYTIEELKKISNSYKDIKEVGGYLNFIEKPKWKKKGSLTSLKTRKWK